MPRLEQWAFVEGTTGDENPYLAPEQRRVIRLQGVVSGDPRREDGHRITTTRVLTIRGRVVTTRTGTQYELGVPDGGFMEYLERRGQKISDFLHFTKERFLVPGPVGDECE
jgi:hypothetical protein